MGTLTVEVSTYGKGPLSDGRAGAAVEEFTTAAAKRIARTGRDWIRVEAMAMDRSGGGRGAGAGPRPRPRGDLGVHGGGAGVVAVAGRHQQAEPLNLIQGLPHVPADAAAPV